MKPNNLCQKIEFMETIHDPYEAQNILSNLLKSANKEVLITLPTKASYRRSNSESTILSYASIYETLWIQAELRGKQK